jgi:hypothetical protein
VRRLSATSRTATAVRAAPGVLFFRGSVVATARGQWNTSVERVLAAQATLRESGLTSSGLEFRISEELASAYAHVGRHDEALAAFGDASRLLTALGRDDTETAARLYNNWGCTSSCLDAHSKPRPCSSAGSS